MAGVAAATVGAADSIPAVSVSDKVPPTDSMDKLHGTANFANLTASYSWNIFRYVGDYLHLFGIVVLVATILKNKSVKGFSRGTQVLYCAVFLTRYLDLFDHSQSFYLTFFKLTYIATSLFVLGLFYQFGSTYEARNDTFNLPVVIIPCFTAAVLLTSEYSILEILWTFSEFIEGFAMVPQYIFCYREKGDKELGTSLYVMSLGTYRVFYAMNWIYKKVQMPHYSDVQSWIGGLIEIVFFADFLNYRFTGNSFLRSMVLTVDTKINEISDKVELKVLGTTRSEVVTKEGGHVRQRPRPEASAAAEV